MEDQVSKLVKRINELENKNNRLLAAYKVCSFSMTQVDTEVLQTLWRRYAIAVKALNMLSITYFVVHLRLFSVALTLAPYVIIYLTFLILYLLYDICDELLLLSFAILVKN